MEGLGAVRAAISVLVVVLARMCMASCLTKLWTYIKFSIASVVKASSVVSHSSGSGYIALIVVARVCAFLDVMTRVFLDRVQDRGHLVKATCGRDQSTSGLCAWS